MKRPDSFLTNTTAPAGRALGQANNDPGGGTGSGVDMEVYNDPAYALIALAEILREGGITDADETTLSPDILQAVLEALNQRVSTVDEWDAGTNYTTVGKLIMQKGHQYVLFNNVATTGIDPITGRAHWFPIPSLQKLLDEEAQGKPMRGGFSDMSNIQHANYRQVIEFGRFRIGYNGDSFYNFFKVHLDGTQLSGNGVLEAIFDPGGPDEYWNIDVIAPDNLGTRTFLNSQGYGSRAMTGGGGVAATLGEVQIDEGQAIEGTLIDIGGAGDIDGTGAFTKDSESSLDAQPGSSRRTGDFTFASSTSISPNAAKTNDVETRVKTIVEGVSYIYAMQEA